MKRSKPMTALLIGGFLVFTLTSCAAVVAGGAGAAAAYTYAKGWLTRDYEVSMDQAYQASIKTFQEKDIKIVDKSQDVASAKVEAESDNQKYWVELESKGDNLTTVSVRAGLMGDRQAAQKIQQDIQANL